MTESTVEELTEAFLAIGLDKTKAKEAAKNKKLSATLTRVISEVRVDAVVNGYELRIHLPSPIEMPITD